MDEAGELIEWDDDRGFGFIRTAEGARLFVHIKAFGRLARRPAIGDRLAFSRGPGRDGKPVAVRAVIAGLARSRVRRPTSTATVENAQLARAIRIAAAAILLLAVVAAQTLGVAPRWLLLVYLALGIFSMGAYWLDKRAARAKRWRTAEVRLLGLDLVGGIIGGLLAQALLHHKTAKASFARATAVIVFIHAAALGALILGLVQLPAGL